MESWAFSARPGGISAANAKTRPCGLSGCSEHAIVMLDFRSLCLQHVVSHCYSRLQEFEQGDGFEQVDTSGNAQSPPVDFLDECRSKILIVLLAQRELTNLDRARLLDILLWASELMDKGRRWPSRGLAAGS